MYNATKTKQMRVELIETFLFNEKKKKKEKRRRKCFIKK